MDDMRVFHFLCDVNGEEGGEEWVLDRRQMSPDAFK